MTLRIGTNITSLMVQRKLQTGSDQLQSIYERLSSGQRINRASDDAAGLAVSSKLNVDSRISAQAIRNVNDGVSLLNVAEGALDQLSNIVTRQMELAEQSANGVYSEKQRKALQQEASALNSEYNRIVRATTFNKIELFDPDTGELFIQAGAGTNSTLSLDLGGDMSQLFDSGAFQTGTSFTFTGSGGTSFTVRASGDFNNDGNIDLVTSQSVFSTLEIAYGNGNGTFQARTALPDTIGTFDVFDSVMIGDVDNDGNQDIVGIASNGNYNVFRSNGNGTFKASTSGSGALSYGGGLADMNGDGLLDLVNGNSNGFVIKNGDGAGNFGAAVTYAVGPQANTTIGDADGDGDTDVIVGGEYGVQLYRNNGTGSFAISTLITTGSLGWGGSTVADMNGDGIMDITTSVNGYTSHRTFFGNGDGTFNGGTSASGWYNFTDFNGDGIVDRGRTVGTDYVVNLNDGRGNFNTTITSATTPYGPAVIADLNGDGLKDILGQQASGSDNLLRVSFGIGREDSLQSTVTINTQTSARAALTQLSNNLQRLNAERGAIGAMQRRYEVAVNNLTTQRENYIAAASRITDVDVASETADLTRYSILQKVASAVLAQANQIPALSLQLLKK